MLSKRYKYWSSVLDLRRCSGCKKLHGKVYEIQEIPNPDPPLHDRCRCVIVRMEAKIAGTATENRTNGADWWLIRFKHLPSYYISQEDAANLGWEAKLGNLSNVAPGKMLAKGIYQNRNGHLPQESGRIWYEADINYKSGWRNDQRILYSNDGLVFVSYDHYQTFTEIISKEESA